MGRWTLRVFALVGAVFQLILSTLSTSWVTRCKRCDEKSRSAVAGSRENFLLEQQQKVWFESAQIFAREPADETRGLCRFWRGL